MFSSQRIQTSQSISAVRVHVSHAYKKTDMKMKRWSLTLDLRVIVLSFQMVFNVSRYNDID